MAANHRAWIEEMFSELKHGEVAELYRLIGRLKDSVQTRSPNGTEAQASAGEGD
jgi:hypothetical protein